MGGFIDAHCHVWTDDTASYPLAAGHRAEDRRPAVFTPERLLELARPHGVDRVVLIQMSWYGADNSYMLDAIGRHPGVFSGVAVVDRAAGAPGEEMERLALRGVRGFRINARESDPDRQLDGEGAERMFRASSRTGLAICPLLDPDALPALSRMCRRHPEATVVIDHMARIGIQGPVRDGQVEALCGLARLPLVNVKVSAFYAFGAKKPPYGDAAPVIRRLYDAFGPERLLWATDCPFQVVEHSYGDSIALIRDRLGFLSDSDRDWMLRGTAERLFF